MVYYTCIIIEQFKAGRFRLMANPALLDDSIAKLSNGAQIYAKMFRDLMISKDANLGKIYAASAAIMDGLPEDVQRELEVHKREVAKIFGLPLISA